MSILNGEQDYEVHSLTKAGVVLATYLFIVLLTYFVLSAPINMIFDGFQAGNWGAAETMKSDYMDLIRSACTLFFALFISIPIVWFFFWVFHREPAYNEQQPRI